MYQVQRLVLTFFLCLLYWLQIASFLLAIYPIFGSLHLPNMAPKKGKSTVGDATSASSTSNAAMKRLKEGASKISSPPVETTPVETAPVDTTPVDATLVEADTAETETQDETETHSVKTEKDTDQVLDVVSKVERSHFIVAAKRSKDPLLIAAYNQYVSLDRFDQKKNDIVALWKKDKSCTWWNSWKKEQTEGDVVQKDDIAGFGTMRHPQYVLLLFMILSFVVCLMCSRALCALLPDPQV